MNPKTEALAYRIWAYASPRGWNVTCNELAEELDVSAQRIGSTLHAKRWSKRLRVPAHDVSWASMRGSQTPAYRAIHTAEGIRRGFITHDPA